MFLVTVIDACSRRLSGWSITDHLRTELCLDALNAAVGTRGGKRNVAGVIFHSDHGTQPGFKGSSQHCLVTPIVGARRGPPQVSSIRGSFAVAC